MRTYQKTMLGLPLAALVLLSSGTSLNAAENIIGEWEFTMSMGMGGGEGMEMHPKAVFSKAADGTISGTWEMNFQAPEGAGAPAMGGDFQMPTFVLTHVKVEDQKLTFTQTGEMGGGGQSFEMPFEGTIKGDKIEGKFASSFGGGDMVATATRKATVKLEGDWAFEMELGGGGGGMGMQMKFLIDSTFTKGADGKYTATWDQKMQPMEGAEGPGGGFGPPGGGMGSFEVKISDIQLEGKKLSFTQNVNMGQMAFESKFSGTVEGDTITGALTSEQGDMPLSGKRKSADLLSGTWSIETTSMGMGGRPGGGAPGGAAPDGAAAAPRTRTVELTFTKGEDGAYAGEWKQQMPAGAGAGAGPGGGAGPMGNMGAMETKIIDITLDGNKVSFTRSMTMGEMSFNTVYTGTIEDGAMTGTMTRSGGGMGGGMGGGETPFTAKFKVAE